MSNPILLNEPPFYIGNAPELCHSTASPSAGYFHAMTSDVPGRVHIVRTSIPMGLKAFTNKLPTMVLGEHFVWVGNVDVQCAQAMLEGLNRTDKGILDAHAQALADAKAAVGRKYYVRAVMYCAESAGWWVTLGGPRRFRNWRELGLFSSTTALFRDWDDLRAMQYEPHEHDVSNYVKIDADKMLAAAGIKLVKLKRHPSWYDVTTPKPYVTTAGAATAEVPYQPIDPTEYPVQSVQCDGLDGLLPAGLMLDSNDLGYGVAPGNLPQVPAAPVLLPHQGVQWPQQQAQPQVYDRAADDAREQRELEERLAAMRRGAVPEFKLWEN